MTWSLNHYQALAARTRGKATYEQELVRMGLGLTGEAGEVADHLKKVLTHGHKLDFDKLCEELGDVLWYIADGANTLEMDLEDVARANIAKLAARYPKGFSQEASVHRGKSAASIIDAKVLAIMGEAGSGKSTLERFVVSKFTNLLNSVRRVVSSTTRAPREDEVDGAHYHFMDRRQFGHEVYMGSFIEHAEHHGHHYGLHASELEHDCDVYIAVLNPEGVKQVRRRVRTVWSVWLDCPGETRRERLRLRGETFDWIKARQVSEVLLLERALDAGINFKLNAQGQLSDVGNQLAQLAFVLANYEA